MVNFIKVDEAAIESAEKELGFSMPLSLKQFYLKYGYGNLPSSEGFNANLFMHPDTVVNFRQGKDEFSDLPDIELYNDYNQEKLVFFEVNESAFFALNIKDDDGKVYYWDKIIANSIQEFVVKMIEDEEHYLRDIG